MSEFSTPKNFFVGGFKSVRFHHLGLQSEFFFRHFFFFKQVNSYTNLDVFLLNVCCSFFSCSYLQYFGIEELHSFEKIAHHPPPLFFQVSSGHWTQDDMGGNPGPPGRMTSALSVEQIDILKPPKMEVESWMGI